MLSFRLKKETSKNVADTTFNFLFTETNIRKSNSKNHELYGDTFITIKRKGKYFRNRKVKDVSEKKQFLKAMNLLYFTMTKVYNEENGS